MTDISFAFQITSNDLSKQFNSIQPEFTLSEISLQLKSSVIDMQHIEGH